MEAYVLNLENVMKAIADVIQKFNIRFTFIGGAARNLYNYPSTTEDVDILVDERDIGKMENLPIGYMRKISGKRWVFNDPKTKIDVIYSGEGAGNDVDGIKYENPETESVLIGDVPVLTLHNLIKYKLSSGLYGEDREKDFIDIKELIRRNRLPLNFVDNERPDLADKYRELWAKVQKSKKIDDWNNSPEF